MAMIKNFSLVSDLDANNPPVLITRENYRAWLTAISSQTSAFFDHVFDWYEQQLRSDLPTKVQNDPDKLYVDVKPALAETIALEKTYDIEKFTTVGFDTYGLLDIPISVALE